MKKKTSKKIKEANKKFEKRAKEPFKIDKSTMSIILFFLSIFSPLKPIQK